ncbi:hypothetical protein PR202_gb28366 [Eleusine coracana subsp. coracana]|uniref:26S proteasome non-ATPase regulatory subunit 2 homolog n=1 Tax=Eleusine coracana subsp. coracana TaxID=191504 RepID=A0AAV5FWT2_ELECO|nr:hypothetical protein PR202_gb28366 [Eleusine coracana subsp. coracana]
MQRRLAMVSGRSPLSRNKCRPAPAQPGRSSEEDQALKEKLELYVCARAGLRSRRPEVGAREHEKYMADILSGISLNNVRVEGERESLKYRMMGSEGDIGSWGHEYVRNLAGEIAQEFQRLQHNAEPEAVDLLMEFGDLASALRIALLLDNKLQYVKQVYTATDDLLLKKQFSYIVARHVHLIDGRGATSSSLDSARQNLAATFVNAFVNAGFGQDKLMTAPSDSSGGSSGNWLFKNKEHGKASAAASLGMILLWDSDSGLAQLDKYLHSNDTHVVAGALLGIGIVSCGVKNDCDPAFALISEYIGRDESIIRIGAILGLGIAYAGSQKDELQAQLSAILADSQTPLEVLVFTAISLGLVFIGSCNEEIAQSIIFVLMDRSEAELAEPIIRLLPVALGLLYLGKQESVEATAEVSKTFDEKIRKYCDVTLMSLAYAGTGNVLKVQKLLGICSEHLEKGETHQGPAVLGIALISMAEELGADMAVRSLERLLQYGEQNIRRAVPLALGMLCISNPKVNVMDTLSRLSHDADAEVSMAAIISLGLIGAGTNNARIAGMLRNLSSYYYKEAGHLFCVRIAQGLAHLGKGLLTLSPYHSDRFLLSPIALAGLVTVLHACLDMKSIILGKYHYMLYILVLAMQPRMLLTVDQDLKPLSVPVRVGQAVDVVGQAGKPKTITGFQTHSTPVLLAAGERAELATEKYVPLSPFLEGFVILKKNPEYHDED